MSTLSKTFGVSFYLKKSKANQRGTCPIYARITVNGKRVEISVKRTVEEANWNAHRGMAKGTREEIVRLNKFLERFRAGIVECYQELLLERKFIAAEMLKDRVTGADEQWYDFWTPLESLRAQNGINITIEEVNKYLSNMETFLRSRYNE